MITSKLHDQVVGCFDRWPCKSAHPDCWEPPHRGDVLALDDPRAWSNTIAFPYPSPPQDIVTAHVERVIGILSPEGNERIPVLYTTSRGEQFVAWEHIEKLRPYDEELAAWEAARNLAYRTYAMNRG